MHNSQYGSPTKKRPPQMATSRNSCPQNWSRGNTMCPSKTMTLVIWRMSTLPWILMTELIKNQSLAILILVGKRPSQESRCPWAIIYQSPK
ncbi:hypothetical protein FGO68_gene10229 [Halteria grandinella]|uniref:Uncharacterized protein n=1 Tax=Halteria grandinella TaxID=5974 RepID=A0A8J8NRX2_HALGN|nr:hypothetical protein FGO68_gene10229 [Halteria grandinella]